jgi:hypothetical protein
MLFSNKPPKLFVKSYNDFTKKHGDLYSKRLEPMTEGDIAPVIKNDRFTRKITFPVFISCAILSFCGSIYMFIDADWLYTVGFIMCGIALTSLAYYLRGYYAELLQKKEKVILAGIVFRKRKLDGSDLISVSDQIEVFLESKDAKRLKLGDIVEIECLSLERYIRNTVSIKGNIAEILK